MLKKITFLLCSLLVSTFLISEVCFRVYFSRHPGVPFLSSPKRIINSFYYPELKTVDNSTEEDSFRILILSGSAFHKNFGKVETCLLDGLNKKTHKKIKIFNLAMPAQTSRDSFFKYEYLKDKPFDLVIFYHGLNEARANNCPDSMFREDYSHYSWYRLVNRKTRYENNRFFVTPFVLDYIFQNAKDRFLKTQYVPKHAPKEEWMDYGNKIKTAEPFKENLTSILEIAKTKNETVLLLTYAYYIPADYSLSKFKAKALDYQAHGYPIEIWGKPENAEKAIQAHNQVVRELAVQYPYDLFLDQEKLMAKNGKYYDDICHFSPKGSKKFADNITGAILFLIRNLK